MLSKYRMEKVNPEMEKARLTSRLNAVRQRIKEVEEQLDEARRNAAFESKYKDDPYWKIAKKRYIETGDPAAIENFRAKQDALEEAEKNRKSREAIDSIQKQKELLYNKAEATKKIRLADTSFKAAIATGDDKVEIPNAQTELEAALEYYKNVTGEDYDYKWPEGYPKVKGNNVPPAGQNNGARVDSQENDESSKTDTGSWLSNAPLYKESGAKNAKEYAAYLIKFADNADGKFNAMRLSAADKQRVDDFLATNKGHWSDMGINDQDVARIKSHISQEAYDAKIKANKDKINNLKLAYNEALKANDEAEKEKFWNELEKLNVKMPKDTNTPFDIQ